MTAFERGLKAAFARDMEAIHKARDARTKAVITIGARGQYRISIDHSPLDSEPSLAEAEETLRYYGQTAYRFLTDDGVELRSLALYGGWPNREQSRVILRRYVQGQL